MTKKLVAYQLKGFRLQTDEGLVAGQKCSVGTWQPFGRHETRKVVV